MISSDLEVLLGSYTPGRNAWIYVAPDSIEVNNSSKINKAIINELIENGSVELLLDARVSYTAGKKEEATGIIDINVPRLYYKADDGQLKQLALNENQIKLKSVSKNDLEIESYYKKGNTNVLLNPGEEYNVDDNSNTCRIILENFLEHAPNRTG